MPLMTQSLNGVFYVLNFKTRTAQTLSHVGIGVQSSTKHITSSTKHSTSRNCMRITSSYSKVLVSVKAGELQAAEYEEMKAAEYEEMKAAQEERSGTNGRKKKQLCSS